MQWYYILIVIIFALMNTKEKILAESLRLFNAMGVNQVSQRTITNSMGISPGNLTYHFKKKRDIELALYYQLVEVFDQMFAEVELEASLTALFKLGERVYDCFNSHRFFFADYTYLMREHAEIRAHYTDIQQKRKKQFQGLIHQLIQQKVLRKEFVPNEYTHWYERQRIFVDFFIVAQLDGDDFKEQFKRQMGLSVLPYLTTDGRAELAKLL